MKNRDLIKDVIMQVGIALLIQFILYVIAFLWANFSKEKLSITVCSSVPTDTGYFTSVNLKNFQDDKSIKNIIIWSSANITLKNMNYEDVEVYEDRIIIKNIPPLYDGTIFISSSEKINEKNIRFETQEKRIVEFLYDQKEEIAEFWKIVTPTLIIYVVVYGITASIISILNEKNMKLCREKLEEIEDLNKDLDKRLLLREKEMKELTEAKLKLRIFLHRKLVDYAKELDFYRTIIKNVVNEKNNKEDICYQITKELKTFRTIEKINVEDLEIDILELSDLEKENNKELNV